MIFSGYMFAHKITEEHNTHDEPYGYELGDDPFEAQGQGDYPMILLFFATVGIAHYLHAHFRFDNRKVAETFYHQRLTAFQIEDEIRKIRKEAH
mmetsp:Transcript_41175/g.30278  ORF Transcript_41175/g.30278 Transcript_41175/m.30278 type:complete len:94 (-) Transcript_41175:36-317(-)